jgi:predicted ATPase
MITQVSLRNVRLFADETRTFRLAPLTVFCGSNSSGKSTILKIFPLLRQSQGIRESAEEESGKLRFKGTQVDLGNYSSLVSNNETSRQIQLGIRISNDAPRDFIAFLRYLKENKGGEFKPPDNPDEAVTYELDCSFQFLSDTQSSAGSAPPKPAKLAGGALLKAEFAILQNGETLLSWSTEKLETPKDKSAPSPFTDEPYQRLYKFHIPTALFQKIGMADQILPHASERPEVTTLIALLKGLLPALIIADPKPDPDSQPAPNQHDWQRWPLPTVIDWQFEHFKHALQDLHYVAPLRSPGKRYYVADLDVVPGMDPTGEFLPYILRDKCTAPVINALPDALGKRKEQSLAEALGGWLRYLRTGNFKGDDAKQTEFELATPEILVELKLNSLHDSRKHSLADSGFGYSQIVPVLVRGLLVPPDGTLIVEQPELHLHPALQVRIADFFLAMSSIGKQIIIETHSEHLVNALRVRAAEDPHNKLHSLCKIYYLSTDSDKPQVHDLSVQPDGSLSEWPESFFGEALTLSGRLLRAQAKSQEKQS